MEIQANPLDWAPPDAENLAKFLDTPTGQRLVRALTNFRPELLDRGHVNAILIRSGEVRAYTKMVDDLFHLAHGPIEQKKPQVNTEMPPPEADEFWDGPKLSATGDQAYRDMGLEPPPAPPVNSDPSML